MKETYTNFVKNQCISITWKYDYKTRIHTVRATTKNAIEYVYIIFDFEKFRKIQ